MLLDTYFVGKLETAALTALGGSTNVMFLLFSLAFAMGTASTALVSRAYGAGQPEEFKRANRETLSTAIYLSFGLSVVGLLISPIVSRMLLPASDTRAIQLMIEYLAIYCLGLPAYFIIQSLAGSLRGVGDTKSPMVISGLQILLHVVLNYCLIFPRITILGLDLPGAGWGLRGAGAALTISAWLASLVYVLWAGRTPVGESWRIVWPDKEWFIRIMRIAMPAAVMSVVRVSSLFAFTLVLKGVENGSYAIAAMTTGFRLESMAFMPAFGLSIAASALVGQSLGMKRPERAERLGWVAAHYAAAVSGLIALVLFIFAEPISAHLIEGQRDVIPITASFLRFICATELFFAYGVVLVGGMQGAGDTKRPLWISLIALWGLRVPLAVVLAYPVRMGADGAWLAMSATQLVQGLMCMVAWRQGKWKLTKV